MDTHHLIVSLAGMSYMATTIGSIGTPFMLFWCSYYCCCGQNWIGAMFIGLHLKCNDPSWCYIIYTAPDTRTCAGLEQLAKNTNPRLISKCISNDICSKIICQTSDDISNYLDTVALSLEPCKFPRGVTFELLKDGQSLFSQLITMPTKISQTIGSATIEALVFVNTTCSILGISVSVLLLSTS